MHIFSQVNHNGMKNQYRLQDHHDTTLVCLNIIIYFNYNRSPFITIEIERSERKTKVLVGFVELHRSEATKTDLGLLQCLLLSMVFQITIPLK